MQKRYEHTHKTVSVQQWTFSHPCLSLRHRWNLWKRYGRLSSVLWVYLSSVKNGWKYFRTMREITAEIMVLKRHCVVYYHRALDDEERILARRGIPRRCPPHCPTYWQFLSKRLEKWYNAHSSFFIQSDKRSTGSFHVFFIVSFVLLRSCCYFVPRSLCHNPFHVSSFLYLSYWLSCPHQYSYLSLLYLTSPQLVTRV